MDLQTIKSFFGSVKGKIVEKAPDILTAFNVLGVFATGWTMHKATKKATAYLESEKAKRKEENPDFTDFSAKEKLLLTWKFYIWPFVTGALTIGSSIASNRISSTRLAESAAMTALLSDKVEKLEAKIEEKYGKEELDKAKKEIHDEQLAGTENGLNGEMLCYEPVSKQYFKATQQQLLMAELTANKMFQNDHYVRFNDFLELLGCKRNASVEDYSWVMGDIDGDADFNWSFYKGEPWIDIQPRMIKVNGKYVLEIAYGMWPMESPEWTNDSNCVFRSKAGIDPEIDKMAKDITERIEKMKGE